MVVAVENDLQYESVLKTKQLKQERGKRLVAVGDRGSSEQVTATDNDSCAASQLQLRKSTVTTALHTSDCVIVDRFHLQSVALQR